MSAPPIKEKHDDISWQKPTRIPPIGRGGEFLLKWLGDTDVAVMAASYEDFLTADTKSGSRGYTVSMSYDENRIQPRRELPRWDITESFAHWQREENSAQKRAGKYSFIAARWRSGRLGRRVRGE
jgi:hypothetical protein